MSLNGSKLELNDDWVAPDWSLTGGGGAARDGVLLVALDFDGAGGLGGGLLFFGGSAGVGLSDRNASPELAESNGENPNGSLW